MASKRYVIEDDLRALLAKEIGSEGFTLEVLQKLIERNETYVESPRFGASYATAAQQAELKKAADQRHRKMLKELLNIAGVSESIANRVLDECIFA